MSLQEAYLLLKREHGDRPHPDVANSLMGLSLAYFSLGETRRAIEYHEQSLAMLKLIHGDRPQPDVALSLANLGNTYLKSGDRPKAFEWLESAYQIFLKTVGAEHPHAKWIKKRLDSISRNKDRPNHFF